MKAHNAGSDQPYRPTTSAKFLGKVETNEDEWHPTGHIAPDLFPVFFFKGLRFLVP